MARHIKRIVSKNKNRYVEDGFDLDLTYIRPNIVAMGFPSEKFEGVIRNNMQDVIRMFDRKYPNHYKVYNLCSERSYDPAKFHGRVASYPFDDHNAPPFGLIKPFCEDMDSWLNEDSGNIALVHCKAGKGRTGVMICSYLLHIKWSETVKEALDFYADARTKDKKGVTIPSQRRYVQYYGHLIRNSLVYSSKTVLLKAIRLEGIPNFSGGTCAPSFEVKYSKTKIFTSKVYENIKRTDTFAELMLPRAIPLCADNKIEFFHNPRIGGREKMFQFWFNTFFIDWHVMQQQVLEGIEQRYEDSVCSSSDSKKSGKVEGRPLEDPDTIVPPSFSTVSVGATCAGTDTSMSNNASAVTGSRYKVIMFTKQELDKANKDKKHRHFPPHFKIWSMWRVRDDRRCLLAVMFSDVFLLLLCVTKSLNFINLYVILSEFDDPDVKMDYYGKVEEDDTDLDENLSDSDVEDGDDFLETAQV